MDCCFPCCRATPRNSTQKFKGEELNLASNTSGDDKDWLKEYLEHSKREFEDKFKTNKIVQETIDNFRIFKVLGSGSFGKVLLASYKDDPQGKDYAIKVLNKERVIKTKQVDHTMAEKRILGSMNNPFVIKLYMGFKDTTNLYLVMEFANGGELFTLIRKKGRLPEAWAQFYAAQVTLGLQYIHNCGILYRDLKPENILVDGTGYCKLADLGFAKKAHHTWTLCGTPQYLAPEMILNKGYGKSVDYWGLGILIYEMLAGNVPFDHRIPIKLYEMIVACNLVFPSHFKTTVNELLSRIIEVDVTKRYGNLKDGAFDIINHAWFKEVDFKKIMQKGYHAPWVPSAKSQHDASNFDSANMEPLKIGKVDKYVDEFVNF